MTEKLNKYGEDWCILPDCKNQAGHDGYYCKDHHSKYYFGKTDMTKTPNELKKRFEEDFWMNLDSAHRRIMYGDRTALMEDVLDFIQSELQANNQRIVEKIEQYRCHPDEIHCTCMDELKRFLQSEIE